MISFRIALFGIIGAGVAVYIGMNIFLIAKKDKAIKELTTQNAQLSVGLDEQDLTIAFLKDSIMVRDAAMASLHKKISEAEAVKAADTILIDSYRGRLSDVAKAKPILVERRANRALAGVLRRFAEETGHLN